jgi:acyl-CoA reductase-like NAD-dependent aldehyde dehydrogenase
MFMADELKAWRNLSPGDLSIELPSVQATPVEPLLAAASGAARSWTRTPPPERIESLRTAQAELVKAKDELARGIALETGKPITESLGEMNAVISKFDLTIEDALEHFAAREITNGPHPASIRRLARGPAVVTAPFNVPLHLGNGAIVAHLLAGNPVIFKPSPFAAVVAAQYAQILAAALPPNVFQLAQGGAEEGQALCLDPRVRAICFTGSVPVGRSLAQALAADFSKELALELGGRNAAIVCADADLALAADAVAEGACLTCGQRCNATSRVLIDRRIAAEFEGRLTSAFGKYQPGDPMLPMTKLGPLINATAVLRYEQLAAASADWLIPGTALEQVAGKRGYYVRPALRRGFTAPDAESFVPIVEIESFASLDDALTRHNESPFGLTASVFTRSAQTFQRLAEELPVGNVYANIATTTSPSTLPFGGLGMSGNGRPGGRGFLRFTTIEQALQIRSDSLL